MSVDNKERGADIFHSSTSKHIVILGGGFAGIGVLKKIEKYFQNDDGVEITLISKDNFLLFTPMLPEVASGMIETRHIVTPVRAFCNRAKFYAARVKLIDLKNKQITIESPSFTSFTPITATSGPTIINREEHAYAAPLVLSEVKSDEERK